MPSSTAEYDRGNDLYEAGDLDGAVVAYTQATMRLAPEDDALALDLYENLGVALWQLGRWRPAARALLRALDGRLASREQALRLLVSCLFRDGKYLEGERHLRYYEREFGEHPEGWQRA